MRSRKTPEDQQGGRIYGSFVVRLSRKRREEKESESEGKRVIEEWEKFLTKKAKVHRLLDLSIYD